MSKALLLFYALSLLFSYKCSFSQPPSIRFQKSVGSNGGSYEPDFQGTIGGIGIIPKVHMQTRNRNTIVAGNSVFSYPATFVCELNEQDNIVWKKTWNNLRYNGQTFYDAQLRSLQPAADSGFVMMGHLRQGSDAWIVRLNGRGDSVWQRFYGGSAFDEGAYVCRVPNKGYVFIGSSLSLDGTLALARTSDSATEGRVWICRLDESGNPLWSRCFGYPSGTTDRGIIIKTTRDGGFICGANMQSKGYADDGYHGGRDVWLAKLDSAGAIQWAKYYGGSSDDLLGDVEETAEGGFLFVGSTASNNGDVSGSHGQTDAWMVKITGTGSISWQKCIGGSNVDYLVDAIQTQDGGFAAIGTSSSRDGDVVTSLENANVLLVKLSANGTLAWAKPFGGNNSDYGRNVLQTGENDFLISAINLSYFNDPNGNANWFARLGSTSQIKGSGFFDNNNNGVFDLGDKWADNIQVIASKQDGYQRTTLVRKGRFSLDVDTGSYSTALNLTTPYHVVSPVAANSRFNSYFMTDSIGFRLIPIANKQDLSVRLMPITPARPGFAATYQVLYQNVGTTSIPAGTITFKKDPRTRFSSAMPSISIMGGDTLSPAVDTLKWSYSNLKPGDSAIINVRLFLSTPPALNNGDTLAFTAFIDPVIGDETPLDDTARLKQIVVGSYDPNDKAESNAGIVSPSFITEGKPLQYTIRFQNTGTDTAFNIVVRDTLSTRVEQSTLQMVAVSHSYSLSMDANGRLAWHFQNILLPDSNRNEPASHGYIVYTVKPKSDVVAGEVIHNTASIYFDYNLPVLTNDALTLVRAPLVILPQGLINFSGSRANPDIRLSWKVAGGHLFSRFDVERYSNGRFAKVGSVSATANGTRYAFTDAAAPQGTGTYRLRMVQHAGRESYSPVLFVRDRNSSDALAIHPNPTAAQAQLAISSTSDAMAILRMTNSVGRIVLTRQIPVQKGANTYLLDGLGKLSKGLYTVELSVNGRTLTERMIVQ